MSTAEKEILTNICGLMFDLRHQYWVWEAIERMDEDMILEAQYSPKRGGNIVGGVEEMLWKER